MSSNEHPPEPAEVVKAVEYVNFYEDKIEVVRHVNGMAYVSMRPLVENMGLDWKTQHRKLEADWGALNCEHMTTVGSDGALRKMVCVPFKKLFGWLMTVNPKKVRPEIRPKVALYREESCTALESYWSTGVAIRPGATVEDVDLSNNLAVVQALNAQTAMYLKVHNKLVETKVELTKTNATLVEAIETVEEQKPMVEAFNTLMKRDGTLDMGELAANLADVTNGMGRNSFIAWMRSVDILCKESCKATQVHIAAKTFKNVLRTDSSGRAHSNAVAYMSGVEYTRDRWNTYLATERKGVHFTKEELQDLRNRFPGEKGAAHHALAGVINLNGGN